MTQESGGGGGVQSRDKQGFSNFLSYEATLSLSLYHNNGGIVTILNKNKTLIERLANGLPKSGGPG